MHYSEIAQGLHYLVEDTRHYSQSSMLKIEAMQTAYIAQNPQTFTLTEQMNLRYYLRVCNYKHFLTLISLEQLWSLDRVSSIPISRVLENCLDSLQTSDNQQSLISFSTENFLFHGAAFLEFFQLYLAEFFCVANVKINKRNTGKEKLYEQLAQADLAFQPKCVQVKQFLEQRVFRSQNQLAFIPENWGNVLRTLRNFIAHRDRTRPDFSTGQTLYAQLATSIAGWQDIENFPFGKFCQYIQNGIFDLYPGLSPILYDLSWKPGPYLPSMYP